MRILFLTHRLPYAPNRGDRLRAYHTLQWLHKRARVQLVSLVHDDEEAGHAAETRAFVDSVTTLRVRPLRNYLRATAALATSTPLTHALLDAPDAGAVLEKIVQSHRPEIVFAFGSGMARFAMSGALSSLPLLLDLVDVDSRKWQDLVPAARWPMSWVYRREARTLGAFEARAATQAVATLVVNEREADLARRLAPDAAVRVIANGVELTRLAPEQPPSERPRIVFCGVMNYAPNDQGAHWFVNEVWPIVKRSRPDATLAIVGADPSRSLQAVCAADPSIEVTGRVPDVRPWLWDSAVGIAPLQVARGVQNKALEAIAAGLPIVITPAVAGGLPPSVAPASLTGETAATFATGVLALLALAPAERRARAEQADLSSLTWDQTLAPLAPLLDEAARQYRASQTGS